MVVDLPPQNPGIKPEDNQKTNTVYEKSVTQLGPFAYGSYGLKRVNY